MACISQGVWTTTLILTGVLLLALVICVLITISLINSRLARVMRENVAGVRIRGGAGVPGPAAGGAPTSGMAYRSYEGDVVAVDTLTNLTAFGGNAQTIEVPQGARVLDSLRITMSVDYGAAVVSVRAHCQVRIIGQGFRNSPHDFNGPAQSCQGVTSGLGISGGECTVEYEDMAIAVVGGGVFEIQAVLIGEDPGDTTISVGMGFLIA